LARGLTTSQYTKQLTHKRNMTDLHSAKLIHITDNAEDLIAYMARVSSTNQTNPNYTKLLSYCLNHGHFSIFEMASMCVEITTTRAIETQIIRHRSFSFQSLSQRYSNPSTAGYEPLPSLLQSAMATDWRLQDTKNRQNSIEPTELQQQEFAKFSTRFAELAKCSQDLYDDLLDAGIAKECARGVLSLNQPTRLYMHGTIRSWIHYLQVRTKPDVQKEHRLIANSISSVFKCQMPIIHKALFT